MRYAIGYKWKGEWVPVVMPGDSLWVLRGMPQLYEVVQTQGEYTPLHPIIVYSFNFQRREYGGQKIWFYWHGFRSSNLRYCSFSLEDFYCYSTEAFLAQYPTLVSRVELNGRW